VDPTGGRQELWGRALSTGWSDQTGWRARNHSAIDLESRCQNKTSRCIGEELEIRRSLPKEVRDNSVAIPEKKKLQPPNDIPANFSVEGYMMVG